MLQVDVNERTAALERREPDRLLRSEEHRREIESAGREQGEVRGLAIRMVRGASGGEGG